MTDPPRPPAVVRYLRAAVGPAADGPCDADLLARFSSARDQGAFELLVWRHAGLVFGVCRGCCGTTTPPRTPPRPPS
ncbi:MAG: hypothetical protein U0871_16015 [Gemmataceae bacterium]